MSAPVGDARPVTARPPPGGRAEARLRPGGARVGMAHIGVGAFHRCHQAEYTDDLLAHRFDRWGVVGINIRDPAARRHARPAGRPLHAPDPRRRPRRGARHRQHRLGRRQPGKPGARARRARLARDRRGHADSHGKGLLPQAGERRARPRTIPTSSTISPTRRRRAACPASSRARWSCACSRTAGRSR